MKLTVQVVLETDDDQDPAVVCDVFTLERGPLTADTVGLRLAETNDLLAAVQQTLVAEQARATVALTAAALMLGAIVTISTTLSRGTAPADWKTPG